MDFEVMTVAEACATLRVGRTKLYELIRDGHLDTVKFGQRSTRIKRESVRRLTSDGISSAAA